MNVTPDDAKIIIEEIKGLRNYLQEISNKLDGIEKKIKLNLPQNMSGPVQYYSPIPKIQDRKNSY